MQKLKILTILFFSLFSSAALSQDELNGYLKVAAENNPGLKAKFNEYMAALEVAPQVKSLPDPQVAFAYFINPVETRVGPQRLRVSASQLFPWFGTLGARENSAIQAAKAKYEIFEEEKSRLFNEVKGLYYNFYFNEKSISIIRENINLLRIINKLVISRVEAGSVSMVDHYRLRMEINDLENQLALLRDNKWVLQNKFRNLLNTEEDLDITVPENLWTTDFHLTRQAALDSVKNGNHQLLELEFRQVALNHREEAARLSGYPQIRLGLDYIVTGAGENNLTGKDAFVFPVVGLTIPLYRNKYKAMVNEVAYLETANEYRSEEKSNSLEILFDKAWKDYLDAVRRISLNQDQLDLSKKSLDLLETEYASGKESFEEILRMERKVLKYNLEFEKAKADKQAAISFLNYLMGK